MEDSSHSLLCGIAMLKPWSTRAINLPEHAHNPIHTDVGAQAAGFPSAIVAGVSVYAYLTHPPAAAWGQEWLSGGGGELRLRQPVLADDLVELDVGEPNDTCEVVARSRGQACASLELWRQASAPDMRAGEDLPLSELELTSDWATYGTRAGDDLALYGELGVAHPALWPNLANTVYTEHLVTGSWIHTRSRIFHQGLARTGQLLRIESRVIDRFETRAGERAVTDIAIFADDAPVVRIEHEALVALK